MENWTQLVFFFTNENRNFFFFLGRNVVLVGIIEKDVSGQFKKEFTPDRTNSGYFKNGVFTKHYLLHVNDEDKIEDTTKGICDTINNFLKDW